MANLAFGGYVMRLQMLPAVLIALFILPAKAANFMEMVPMPDGVELATYIYLPDYLEGPWPTILTRTPYSFLNPNDPLLKDGLELITSLGYAVVIQETRGNGASKGEAKPFIADREDGLATLNWLLAQPWCDQRVFTVGASALGITEYLMAPGADPALKCQLIAIATPDVYAHAIYFGGVLRYSDVTKWTSWLGYKDMVQEVLAHRDCDSFWEPVRVASMGADVRTAAIHIGGWSDIFLQGTIDGFLMYQNSADPWVASHQYLVIGPWSHEEIGTDKVGEFVLPPVAKWDMFADIISWLQWCRDGYNDIVDSWPRVRYFVMGAVGEDNAPGNEWREADDWPPFPTEEHALFLLKDHALGFIPEDSDAEVTIPFDPANPSPTVGGNNLTLAAGPMDQSKIENRPDAAVFTGDVLTKPLEVTGRIRARLFVSTDGPDADVAVRLTDVYPDGRSMLVTDGIVRLSRREGCDHSTPVLPGEIVEVSVDLWTISWVFNAGHRIRVIVTGSNYPRFELCPSITTPITITVFSSPERPSAILLPLPAAGSVAEEVSVIEAIAEEAQICDPQVTEEISTLYELSPEYPDEPVFDELSALPDEVVSLDEDLEEMVDDIHEPLEAMGKPEATLISEVQSSGCSSGSPASEVNLLLLLYPAMLLYMLRQSLIRLRR